ncbi:MAG: hypothetical protein KFF50_06300 [Desulfatitalea sp.]|nr:hypothetical protein [Desulfatitalea sp.]
MQKNDAKQRLMVFIKAGLPYTVVGLVVIFAGIWAIKHLYQDSSHLSLLLFGWLAVFWFVYQPLFRRRIQQVKRKLNG